jgi:hypothetical protein
MYTGTQQCYQNSALCLISGALKFTLTAACEMHCYVEPLERISDKAAMILDYMKDKKNWKKVIPIES